MLDYVERVSRDSEEMIDLKLVQEHFDVTPMAAKASAIASVNFNNRFAYAGWSGRNERGKDGYGARRWLSRHYKLDEDVAARVIARFEDGDEVALGDELGGFEGLAKVVLTKAAQDDLKKFGFLVGDT